MGGCAAINCVNRSEKGFRMFRFPSNPDRKRQWILNCRRGCWNPNDNSRLCEAHFEQSQFEANRADKVKKLKQTAVPTLFDVSNPPSRSKKARSAKSTSILEEIHVDKNIPAADENTILKENVALRERVQQLESQLEDATTQLSTLQTRLARFLTEDQIEYLLRDPN